MRKRKNGTPRGLPHLAPGTTQRDDAEAVLARRTKGDTIDAIAEDLKMSIATARRIGATQNWLSRSMPASMRTIGP